MKRPIALIAFHIGSPDLKADGIDEAAFPRPAKQLDTCPAADSRGRFPLRREGPPVEDASLLPSAEFARQRKPLQLRGNLRVQGDYRARGRIEDPLLGRGFFRLRVNRFRSPDERFFPRWSGYRGKARFRLSPGGGAAPFWSAPSSAVGGRFITSTHTGAAPLIPLTFHMGSPEKFPTHTPTVYFSEYPDAPVVPHVLAGPGFHRSPKACAQGFSRPKVGDRASRSERISEIRKAASGRRLEGRGDPAGRPCSRRSKTQFAPLSSIGQGPRYALTSSERLKSADPRARAGP